MHAFFLTRGIKRDVDEVVKFLETRTFHVPFKDRDGNEFLQPIQGNLQPVQLWSYVFPENAKDSVLNTLRFDEHNQKRWISNPKMRLLVEGLRVAMGAKKIPEFKKDKHLYMPLTALTNVAIVPIGVKYDGVQTTDGKTHEAL